MSLNIIVVAYNHNVFNSPVVMAFLKSSRSKNTMLIVDNSTNESIVKENKEFCQKNDLEFLKMEGNKGLSIAYNIAIKHLQTLNKNEWFIIFDQDTFIDDGYFKVVEQSLNEDNNIKIHVPMVYTESGIFSPLLFKDNSIVHLEPLVKGVYKNLACINSGIVINKDVFEVLGYYNEQLFLDMVDYNFCQQYRKKYTNAEYKVFEYEIKQDFSGENFGTLKGDLNRFNIYIKDYSTYCKINNISSINKYKTLFKRAVKLSLGHKNLKFLICLINKNGVN